MHGKERETVCEINSSAAINSNEFKSNRHRYTIAPRIRDRLTDISGIYHSEQNAVKETVLPFILRLSGSRPFRKHDKAP